MSVKTEDRLLGIILNGSNALLVQENENKAVTKNNILFSLINQNKYY